MTSPHQISGRQVAAARALTGISRAELAKACGLPVEEMGGIEAGGSTLLPPVESAHVVRILDSFGIVFIAEGDGPGTGFGAGVRLKFTRADARQLGRLEGEGGRVAEDDVP